MGREENHEQQTPQVNRRLFLKAGAAGTALSAIGLASLPAKAADAAVQEVSRDQPEGPRVSLHKDFPAKVDLTKYKRFSQKNTAFSHAIGGLDPHLAEIGRKFESFKVDESQPGFTRTDWALHHGSWAIEHAATPGSKFGLPGQGWYGWKQKSKKERDNFLDLNYVYDDQHKFATKQEAADVIKRAARHFKADLIGITKHNPMWDYDKHFVALNGQEFGWDKFPFKPKTVIMLAFEMDYESIATAPTYTLEGAIGEGYSQMAITSYQLSVFLKTLGYQAVAAGNDLSASVPYAIQAGLGGGGRNGLLVTYKYGPRVRLAKVYTDMEFVEYDKPATFGVRDFCERCQRCADACPGKAIPKNVKPTMAPPADHEHPVHNNPGVEKWYLDAYKCFEYWCKGNNSCATCITSCPYNKPDFWHHRMIDKITALMPGPVHTLMRQMDILFGYGDSFDKKAVKRFWSSRNRKYLGYK